MTSFDITFIIPVYNADRHISKCLDSILLQTDMSWEAIFINDASKDKTAKILDDFAATHPQITVLHNTVNLGPAGCRNMGLALSRGKYIWFVDADDWLEPYAFQVLKDHLKKSSSDVIGFKAQMYDNKSNKISIDSFRDLSIIPKSSLEKDCPFADFKNYAFRLPLEVWSRLFRTEFLVENKIKFDESIWGIDDGIFLIECFFKASTIYHIDEILYTYRTNNPRSIVSKLKSPSKRNFDVVLLYAKRCDQLLNRLNLNPEDYQDLILRNLDRIIHTLPHIKGSLKVDFFYLLKQYLLESKTNDLNFVKQSRLSPLLTEIEDLDYKRYFIKNLILQKSYSQSLTRISVFRLNVYKEQLLADSIKRRGPLSIIKTVTYLNSSPTECHLFLFGLRIYRWIK